MCVFSLAACPAGCRECEWDNVEGDLMCKSSGCMEGYGQSLKKMCIGEKTWSMFGVSATILSNVLSLCLQLARRVAHPAHSSLPLVKCSVIVVCHPMWCMMGRMPTATGFSCASVSIWWLHSYSKIRSLILCPPFQHVHPTVNSAYMMLSMLRQSAILANAIADTQRSMADVKVGMMPSFQTD